MSEDYEFSIGTMQTAVALMDALHQDLRYDRFYRAAERQGFGSTEIHLAVAGVGYAADQDLDEYWQDGVREFIEDIDVIAEQLVEWVVGGGDLPHDNESTEKCWNHIKSNCIHV